MKFNFKFLLSQNVTLNENVLESFRSSFWLEEKHWYVALNKKSIYSIPRFRPQCINYTEIDYPPTIRYSTRDFLFKIDKYLPFISMKWLRRTIYRLRREKFTYQTDDYYLMLSIGNKQ
jgi:hypothetical protein